jgi:hypothetical protein
MLGPADLNPALWLDASSIATTGDNGAVLRWPDLSGHHRDAVFVPFVINWDTGVRLYHQPPNLTPDAINGLPAVSFNALYGQTLVLSAPGRALDRKALGFTLVFVLRCRQVQPQVGPRYLFITHNREHRPGEERRAGDTRFAIMRYGETGVMRMHVRRAKGAISEFFEVSSDAGQFGDMEWGVATFVMDYVSNCAAQRYNGREIASQVMPGSGETEDCDSPITAIASHSEGNYLTCDIAELIAYRQALAEPELARLEAGLLRKYGIAGRSKAEVHPYDEHAHHSVG